MSGTTVKLSRRYESHGKPFDEVVLREPTYADFFALGEPQTWQPSKGGGGVVLLTFPETISAYIDRCCTSPGSECLQGVSIADAKAIQGAVLGFFRDAPASKSEPTSSSSPLDGAPVISET